VVLLGAIAFSKRSAPGIAGGARADGQAPREETAAPASASVSR
jgi:hypothetical protein